MIERALDGVKVVEYCNLAAGPYCGKVLADFGAEVIKVESPGIGDEARGRGPYLNDIPCPETSGLFLYLNTNKLGVTLNLEPETGKEIFKKLVAEADVLIEDKAPGEMEKLGLGYDVLKKINPRLVMVSITPYGQTGPYRDYKDSDIVVMGMSGTLYQTGESDGTPVHISMPQACLHAGADAAVGSMMAYYYREMTGEGQHVDISMQQSAAWFQANAIPTWELNKRILTRAGAFRAGMSREVGQRQVWPCKDGYVFFNVIGGRTGAKTLSALVEWMDGEGLATDLLLNMDWDNFDMFIVGKEEMVNIQEPIGEFFKTHTAKELWNGAVPRQISIGPLSGMQDLLEDEGLLGRNFWKEIEHPELGTTVIYPSQFVQSSEENYSIRFRAPLIGEHNEEVYSTIGLSKEELVLLKQAGII